MPPDRRCLLVDSNVLIDYQRSDLSVITLVTRHVGDVCVHTVVLDEVDGLDEADLLDLGVRVVEPDHGHLEAAREARAGRPGLSLADGLCVVLARESGWECVTNDRALRRVCTSAGVSVRWGLELMVGLVECQALGADEAAEIAGAIHEANPFHVGKEVVERFVAKLGAIDAGLSDV